MTEEQHAWDKAEHCYRESLMLNERVGNTVNVAMACNQLANVAQLAGRPIEAEGWYKRALEMCEKIQPGSYQQAAVLNNLARLLKNEVRAGRVPATCLAEARGYAERALVIAETLDASAPIWLPLGILADIAEMEGRTEVARAYCSRERETFAAFAGNRWHIDQLFGELIAAIVKAASGDKQVREAVEAQLPQYEAVGWHIEAATRRIWAGEREWHALVDGLDRRVALLVRRVLETLAEGSGE